MTTEQTTATLRRMKRRAKQTTNSQQEPQPQPQPTPTPNIRFFCENDGSFHLRQDETIRDILTKISLIH